MPTIALVAVAAARQIEEHPRHRTSNESGSAGSFIVDAAKRLRIRIGAAVRELVDRASRGDRDAFAALATAYADRLYAIAYRIVRDSAGAQDATQQALIGAWRDLPGLRDKDRFDGWLTKLVVNACYVELRSRRRHVARVRAVAGFDLPSDTQRDPAISIADRDALDHAFRRLTSEQRAVVVSHHYLGYPLTEIAESLGIPVGTARSRLHYAVRQLRAALDLDARKIATSQERSA